MGATQARQFRGENLSKSANGNSHKRKKKHVNGIHMTIIIELRRVVSFYEYTEMGVRYDGRTEGDGVLHRGGRDDSVQRCERSYKEERRGKQMNLSTKH